MEEERVGAYILDENGKLIPDLNDIAMFEREKLKKLTADNISIKKKEEEVKENAISDKIIDISKD